MVQCQKSTKKAHIVKKKDTPPKGKPSHGMGLDWMMGWDISFKLGPPFRSLDPPNVRPF